MIASLCDAGEMARRVRAKVFSVDAPSAICEWAATQRIFTADGETRYDLDWTPWARGILSAAVDPACRELLLCMGTQLGKTEIQHTLVRYTIDQQPRDILFYYPSTDLARRVNRDRLIPSIMATPGTSRRLRGSPRDLKNLELHFDRMKIYFGGAATSQQRKSYPAGMILADEIDEFEPGAIQEIRGRAKGQQSAAKFVLSSTPSLKGAGIDGEMQHARVHDYHVPCPHCGTYQILEWRWVIWGSDERRGGDCPPEEAEATARYCCPHCGCEVYDHHKREMVRAGLWVSEGQRIDGKGGDAIVTGEPARATDRWAFRLSSLYSLSPEATFGRAVRVFAGAGYTMTYALVTDWLAQAWKGTSEAIEARQIRATIPSRAAGGYRIGDRPGWVRCVTVACDVQADSVYVTARGWGDERQRCTLWARHIPRVRGAGLREIPLAVADIQRRLQLASLRAVGIDAGHFTQEVYQLIMRMGGGWYAMRGSEGKSGHQTVLPRRIETYPDGTPLPRGIVMIHANTHALKLEVLETLQAGRVPGEESVTLWHMPEDVPAWWLDQVTSEELASQIVNGRMRRRWQLKSGRTQNHALDCEVYHEALGIACGIRRNVDGATKPFVFNRGGRRTQRKAWHESSATSPLT